MLDPAARRGQGFSRVQGGLQVALEVGLIGIVLRRARIARGLPSSSASDLPAAAVEPCRFPVVSRRGAQTPACPSSKGQSGVAHNFVGRAESLEELLKLEPCQVGDAVVSEDTSIPSLLAPSKVSSGSSLVNAPGNASSAQGRGASCGFELSSPWGPCVCGGGKVSSVIESFSINVASFANESGTNQDSRSTGSFHTQMLVHEPVMESGRASMPLLRKASPCAAIA
eukprot:scaffold189979_cov28-Tisochrysis_lutea.AAC.3